jgi:hypothetical protein
LCLSAAFGLVGRWRGSSFRGCAKAFGAITVLRDIDLTIEDGASDDEPA